MRSKEQRPRRLSNRQPNGRPAVEGLRRQKLMLTRSRPGSPRGRERRQPSRSPDARVLTPKSRRTPVEPQDGNDPKSQSRDQRRHWQHANADPPVAAHGTWGDHRVRNAIRSEEHTSELQSLMRISNAVFILK